MAVKILVDPEALRKTAGNLQEALDEIENFIMDIEDLVEESSQFWDGAAGVKYRQLGNQNAEQFYTVLKKLKEHPVELLETARDVEGLIESGRARAEGLSTDVIH